MNSPRNAYANRIGSFDEKAYYDTFYGLHRSELVFATELFEQEFKVPEYLE